MVRAKKIVFHFMCLSNALFDADSDELFGFSKIDRKIRFFTDFNFSVWNIRRGDFRRKIGFRCLWRCSLKRKTERIKKLHCRCWSWKERTSPEVKGAGFALGGHLCWCFQKLKKKNEFHPNNRRNRFLTDLEDWCRSEILTDHLSYQYLVPVKKLSVSPRVPRF